MNVTEGLSGHRGLDGVRWLFAGRPTRRVLRREVAGLLERADMLGPCRLQRAKFKPGRKLTAYYDLQLRSGNGGPSARRPLAVTWIPKGNGSGGASDVTAELQYEAVRRGLATPFRALEAGVPDWGMRILVSPLDERFPQLARLSDTRYLDEVVPVRIIAVSPIRYRPGQRHVLRYAVSGTPECVFAKVYEDDSGREWYDVAVRVADWLESNGDRLAAARPLAYLRDDRAVVYPPARGRPLSELIRRGRVRAVHLARAGAMLRTLHSAPAEVGQGLPGHDLAAEISATARAAEHVDALLPATGKKIHALLERAQAVEARLPPGPPTFTHGDFKADHLWAGDETLTLIDFDRCRIADPAADVGKFLADLHWWYGDGDLERAQAQIVEGYGTGPERLARARVYEAILTAKLALRRVRLFDPDWQARTEALVELADDVLSRVERGST